MKSKSGNVGTILAVALGALMLAASSGCAPGRTAAEAAGELRSPAPEDRLSAARDIEANARKLRGLPPNVTEALLQQFPRETDAKAKGSEITALGYTGDARVKALLDQYIQTSDPNQQRWASRAYKKYAVSSGMVPATHKFEPTTWPYGTSGFPAATFR